MPSIDFAIFIQLDNNELHNWSKIAKTYDFSFELYVSGFIYPLVENESTNFLNFRQNNDRSGKTLYKSSDRKSILKTVEKDLENVKFHFSRV